MTVDWIRAGLRKTGKTRSGLARAIGRSPSAITDLLNGHRRLRADEIAMVSEYLGIEPPRLIGGGPLRPPKAPLIGYVGAGAVAHFYADGQGPFDDVDAPIDSRPSTVAVQIRGHSLGALFDNWLVFYDDIRNPPGRQPGRAHVRRRRFRRAGLDQGLEAQPEHRALESFVQHRSRRSTTSGSTGPRRCAKCGRSRGSGEWRERALAIRQRLSRMRASALPLAGLVMPPPTALEIARALIRCRSVTPADGGALPYLRDLLAQAGFAAELFTFSAPGTPDVMNLYARFGSAAPNLAFAGHTDVVPPGDLKRWRFDPFSAEVADGELWGRGACDMKGGLAAAAAAALRFIAKRPFAGSISFLVTGDEEGPAVNGTVKLLEWALDEGRAFRPLHRRRADLRQPARRHDQARPARLAHRQARDPRPPGPCRLSASRRESDSPARSPAHGARLAAARSRKRRLRALEPRSHQRRRRQQGGQRHSGRGSARLQRPLQRSLDARIAQGGDRAADRRGGAAAPARR